MVLVYKSESTTKMDVFIRTKSKKLEEAFAYYIEEKDDYQYYAAIRKVNVFIIIYWERFY